MREIEKGEIVPQSNDTIEIEVSCAGESLINITQLPSPSRSGVSGTKENTRHLWCVVSPPMGRFQSAEMAGPF